MRAQYWLNQIHSQQRVKQVIFIFCTRGCFLFYCEKKLPYNNMRFSLRKLYWRAAPFSLNTRSVEFNLIITRWSISHNTQQSILKSKDLHIFLTNKKHFPFFFLDWFVHENETLVRDSEIYMIVICSIIYKIQKYSNQYNFFMLLVFKCGNILVNSEVDT